MFKKLTTLFSICCTVVFAQAQTQPDTPPQTDALKARYYNAVEYTNCRLAEFSINASNEPKLKASFLAQCKCNMNGGTDANLKSFFKKNGLAKNARIFSMADSLKSVYTPGLPSNELAANITGFLGSAKLTAFGSTKEGFPDFTKNLSTEIDGIFAQSGSTPAAITTPVAPNGLEPAPIQDATQVSQSGWSKFMSFLVAFLLGVLAGGGLMRYYTLQKAKERAALRRANNTNTTNGNNENEDENEDEFTPDSVHLETQITDLQRELERQQTLNAQLRMSLERAVNPPPPPRPTAPPVAPIPVVQTNAVEEIESIIETPAPIVELEVAPTPPAAIVFFMRIPTYDGLFNDLRKSTSFRPAESVYEFTETGKNKATFVVVTDPATQLMAIQGFSMYLAPACETNDMFPEYDAQKITTVEAGEAVKEGDVWRVIKKAVVELS